MKQKLKFTMEHQTNNNDIIILGIRWKVVRSNIHIKCFAQCVCVNTWEIWLNLIMKWVFGRWCCVYQDEDNDLKFYWKLCEFCWHCVHSLANKNVREEWNIPNEYKKERGIGKWQVVIFTKKQNTSDTRFSSSNE